MMFPWSVERLVYTKVTVKPWYAMDVVFFTLHLFLRFDRTWVPQFKVFDFVDHVLQDGDDVVIDTVSDPFITVEGPLCDDFHTIFELLCMWLCL